LWSGLYYSIKQVATVIAEFDDEIVVNTVYTFYFLKPDFDSQD